MTSCGRTRTSLKALAKFERYGSRKDLVTMRVTSFGLGHSVISMAK